jgi:hypothetical protein
VRFPFTFMGLIALAIGVWIVAYLAVRPALDPVSRDLAAGTAVACFAFGVYVVIRRVRHGPQN